MVTAVAAAAVMLLPSFAIVVDATPSAAAGAPHETVAGAAAAAAAAAAASATVTTLSCNTSCYCFMQEQHFQTEYRVICNNTRNQGPAVLTEDVFAGHKLPGWSVPAYVRVENVSSLQVSHGFVNKWLEHHSCALDIWRGGRVTFPNLGPGIGVNYSKDPFQLFAGMGLVHCEVGRIPPGLFQGKQRIGLRLHYVSLGQLRINDLLVNAGSLKYLQIQDSEIGMIQETKAFSSLNLSDGKAEVILIQDSSVGVISKGALNFSSDALKHILINNVTLGSVENEAISLQGDLKLRIMDSRIADMARDALVAQGSASIELTGNMVVARMKALTSLDCTQPAFHIAGNHIFLVPGSHGGPHHIEWDDRTYLPSNDTKERDNIFSDINDDLITMGPRELIEKTSAEKVLHPKCLNNNLPMVKPGRTRVTTSTSHVIPGTNSAEAAAAAYRGWLLVILSSGLFVAIAVATLLGYLLLKKRRRQHGGGGGGRLRNRTRSETTLVSLVGNENMNDNIPWVNMDHPGHKHSRSLW